MKELLCGHQNDTPISRNGSVIFLFRRKNNITGIIYLDQSDKRVIFMQHGASPHTKQQISKCMGIYAGRRDAPIPWPSRSPDLTPLDFFSGTERNSKFDAFAEGCYDSHQKVHPVTPKMYSTCEVKTSIIFMSATARQRTNGAHIE